jgi:hypothetical protein
MKRLLLGSLLGCMVVGQIFSTDENERFEAYGKEVAEALEAKRPSWELEEIKSGLRATGIAGFSGACAGGLLGVGAHELSSAWRRSAFAPRIPFIRGCAAGAALGFAAARVGGSYLEHRLDEDGYVRRVQSNPQNYNAEALDDVKGLDNMLDTVKGASSVGFVASSLALLRMIFRK